MYVVQNVLVMIQLTVNQLHFYRFGLQGSDNDSRWLLNQLWQTCKSRLVSNHRHSNRDNLVIHLRRIGHWSVRELDLRAHTHTHTLSVLYCSCQWIFIVPPTHTAAGQNANVHCAINRHWKKRIHGWAALLKSPGFERIVYYLCWGNTI